jgi:hypothetical protein
MDLFATLHWMMNTIDPPLRKSTLGSLIAVTNIKGMLLRYPLFFHLLGHPVVYISLLPQSEKIIFLSEPSVLMSCQQISSTLQEPVHVDLHIVQLVHADNRSL